jgi:LysM repeat protein
MRRLLFIGILFCALKTSAQKITAEEYIETYREAAIAEMKRSGVPASITLSQGILETEAGNSELVKKSNNHFGIKCKSDWTGESVRHTDDAPNECFRKYNSAADSYKDHSDYLKTNQRYASLFELPTSDYKGWAYGLKKAGYATNPRYAQIVISNIEKHNLQQYDSGYVFVPSDVAIIENNNPTKNVQPLPVDADLVDAIKSKSKFNGLRAIFASKGTSILAIATAAEIDLVKLLEYNDMKTDGLLNVDQLIYLEKKSKKGNRDYYLATQSETLFDVAQTNAVQLKSLAELNNLSENERIKKGAKIKLR